MHPIRFASLVCAALLGALCLGPVSASAPAFSPAPLAIDVGSTGADGVFNPQTSVEVDLATQGTYDPVHWRVVFNYQSVHVPAGVTVTFKNHPSRAPVVWLSQGDILIEGSVQLNGASGHAISYARSEPGPGGFRGGARGKYGSASSGHSAGLGPGGAYIAYPGQGVHGGSAGHSTPGLQGNDTGIFTPKGSPGGEAYGDPSLTWLIGGSGGAGANPGGPDAAGGGAGGGAILLASNTTVHIAGAGSVKANGGGGGAGPGWLDGSGGSGSGGSIRILADSIVLDAFVTVEALGGLGGGANGADGRIHFGANTFSVGNPANPAAVVGAPGSVYPQMGSPVAEIVEVGGKPVPADPHAGLGTGSAVADVDLTLGDQSTIVIQTRNVPLNSAVYLFETLDSGQKVKHTVTDGVTNPLVVTGGPEMEARTSTVLDLKNKYSSLQARVVLP